jgi:hypothetical protein
MIFPRSKETRRNMIVMIKRKIETWYNLKLDAGGTGE